LAINQEGNQALGDIVGRDKNEITNINQFGTPAPSSHLARLLERYQDELKRDDRTSEKLKELQRYGEPKEDPLIPIETKLKEGNRADLIEFALKTKECFAKQLAREELFSLAQQVTIDFERNLCLVDGRSSFSASSIAYLKAAAHFSLLFASLELDFFRYPKLVVNDNIEDKGMEEERSQNLQCVVVELSKKATVRHQIILATSKIDPSLETDEFCIGPSYTLENKTLQFPNRTPPPK
jgi:hypothetical protein